jgi:predicted nicotinamide N-methyase
VEDQDIIAFIETHLPVEPLGFVPEIRLHQACPASGLRRLAAQDHAFGAPYWAYRWAGGLALARYILDHPASVAGRTVLDLGCGGGLVGIAAGLAGARSVTAADPDRYAILATALNAEANGIALALRQHRPGESIFDAEVILGGDVFYDPEVADRIIASLESAIAIGAEVLVGDPWRAPLPVGRLRLLADYAISERAGLAPSRASVFAFGAEAGGLPGLHSPLRA